MRYRVSKAWQASYPEPIEVAAGAPLYLTGRRDVWDGHVWLWARNGAGQEGWVPDDLVSADPPHIALRDYTARELTCQIGEDLIAEQISHGWAFCRSAARTASGWVPLVHLQRIDTTPAR